jgi:hypothetical protein
VIRAYVTDDFFGMGVKIGIIIDQENAPPMVGHFRDGRLSDWEVIEPGAAVQVPTLTLGDPEARALLDGLTRHFHGAEDTRALRRDYDAERKRVDELTGHLAAIARTLATASDSGDPQ